jgi:hypothetical protein
MKMRGRAMLSRNWRSCGASASDPVPLGTGAFCVLGSAACSYQRGGTVRLSLPHATGPDVLRMLVRFDGRAGPHARARPSVSRRSFCWCAPETSGRSTRTHPPAQCDRNRTAPRRAYRPHLPAEVESAPESGWGGSRRSSPLPPGTPTISASSA